MEGDGHFSVDRIFGVLSHDRRRLALQYFKQNGTPVAVDDLARRIARWEQTSAAVPSDVEVKQVRTALEKTHLPEFEAVGFVTYDSETELVSYDDVAIEGAMENAINVIGFLFAGSVAGA
ncbi:DUF7344 domain-containing protein [Halomarina oriensis]|uniref:DUF7344 domain-containing protein n=1 Tax=Halomarina oriensis TaxID=671145 RepID=A0A6B0GFV9_9EURY|nr:hypothetical protein [Halomarina oriensis]MWG32917.1 hypothetical protein [Halomarina oriensis]